jgi:hypothetical protein
MKISLLYLTLLSSSAFGMIRLAPPQNTLSKKYPNLSLKLNTILLHKRFTASSSSFPNVKCPYQCLNKKECHANMENAIKQLNFADRRYDRGYPSWRVYEDGVEAVNNAGCEENKKMAALYAKHMVRDSSAADAGNAQCK